jgi:hypothetical protein
LFSTSAVTPVQAEPELPDQKRPATIDNSLTYLDLLTFFDFIINLMPLGSETDSGLFSPCDSQINQYSGGDSRIKENFMKYLLFSPSLHDPGRKNTPPAVGGAAGGERRPKPFA